MEANPEYRAVNRRRFKKADTDDAGKANTGLSVAVAACARLFGSSTGDSSYTPANVEQSEVPGPAQDQTSGSLGKLLTGRRIGLYSLKTPKFVDLEKLGVWELGKLSSLEKHRTVLSKIWKICEHGEVRSSAEKRE